jgi:hypothetical protein
MSPEFVYKLPIRHRDYLIKKFEQWQLEEKKAIEKNLRKKGKR